MTRARRSALAVVTVTFGLTAQACRQEEPAPEPADQVPEGVVILSQAQVDASEITTTRVTLAPVRASRTSSRRAPVANRY